MTERTNEEITASINSKLTVFAEHVEAIKSELKHRLNNPNTTILKWRFYKESLTELESYEPEKETMPVRTN
jgi:hypothetical protein